MLSRCFSLLFLTVFCCIFAQAQTEIRRVDFKNFTYEALCISETPEKITVKDGEFLEEKGEDSYVERFYFNAFGFTYGDLTGDGKDEAAILAICNTGGTGNFSEGFVYGMRNGKPELIARFEGGDRAYGGLRDAKIENGFLIVERNDVGEMSGACCPEFVVTTRYRLNGGKLSAIGKEERRELYPSKRVEFAKGTTKSTFKVKITPDEDLKRFIVGARKGQTLNAFSDTSGVYLDIRQGNATVTEIPNGISAKLNENGDFIIQLQHPTETEKEITLTIEIK